MSFDPVVKDLKVSTLIVQFESKIDIFYRLSKKVDQKFLNDAGRTVRGGLECVLLLSKKLRF